MDFKFKNNDNGFVLLPVLSALFIGLLWLTLKAPSLHQDLAVKRRLDAKHIEKQMLELIDHQGVCVDTATRPMSLDNLAGTNLENFLQSVNGIRLEVQNVDSDGTIRILLIQDALNQHALVFKEIPLCS